jgi:hypothetical protein
MDDRTPPIPLETGNASTNRRRSERAVPLRPQIRDNVIAPPSALAPADTARSSHAVTSPAAARCVDHARRMKQVPKRSKGCQECQRFLSALSAVWRSKGLEQSPHVAWSAMAKSGSVLPAGFGGHRPGRGFAHETFGTLGGCSVRLCGTEAPLVRSTMGLRGPGGEPGRPERLTREPTPTVNSSV